MNELRFNLRAVRVPESLTHKARAEEIAELPQYLEVTADQTAGVSLVNYGINSPPADQLGMPWVKLNPDGSPNGVFVHHAGEWVRATPHTVETEAGNLTILMGQGTMTLTKAAGVVDTVDVTTFNPEFKSPPKVFLTFGGSETAPDSAFTDANLWKSFAWRVATAKDKFSIRAKYDVDCTTTNREVVVHWMAIGERE
jgi:hypothetical protein